jgi:hypothetical protein
MGVTPSKLEDDKVLVLCQERKRLVREALDRRCALAAWSAKESAIRLQIPGGAVVSASDLQPPAATPRPRETKGRATQKEKHRRSKRDATHGVNAVRYERRRRLICVGVPLHGDAVVEDHQSAMAE